MNKQDKHSRTVKVNGPELWSDRVAMAPTEEAFLDLVGEGISLSTLQRAERGQAIQLSKLKLMALVLGEPYEKYVLPDVNLQKSTNCELSGGWLQFYVEPDMDHRPALIECESVITQRGANLSISISELGSDGEHRKEVVMDAFISDHLVYFLSCVGDWKPPWGMGSTMLKVDLGENLLRGWVIWLDIDTNRIESSRNIWIRRGCQQFDAYVEKARRAVLEG